MKVILVVSGPSGSGKSTIIKRLVDEVEIPLVVSHTTRKRREGEVEGKDYYFVTKPEFKKLVDSGKLIEYVECFDNYYGTSTVAIEKALKANDICIMDIDWTGAYNIIHNKDIANVKKIGVLILPPSLRVLKQRLTKRRSETEKSLEMRIIESFKPKKIAKYDFVVINSNIEKAYLDLKEVYIKCKS